MAQITLTVPDQHVARVVHALCVAGGHETENVQNAKQTIVGYVKATVRNVESAEAERAALDAVPDPDVDGIVE